MMRTKQLCGLLALPLITALPAQGTLLVHFNFDEAGGTEVTNTGATGATNNGTIGGGNSFVPGVLGTALSRDVADATSGFAAGPTPITGSQARTLSVWVNFDGSDPSYAGGFNAIMSIGTNAADAKFDIDYDGATNLIEIGVGSGRSNTASQTGLGITDVGDGSWHLVTAVLPDGTNDVDDIDIYIDGQFAYDAIANNAANDLVNTNPAGLVHIGQSANPGGQRVGLLDDAAFWGVALTGDEIAAYHSGVLSAKGLDAADFAALKALNDAGSGSTVSNGTRWDYNGSTGSATPGVIGNTLTISSAGTGATDSGIVIGEGDVDLDGDVDAVDLNIIAANFRSSGVLRTAGDLDGNGSVNFSDYFIWRDNAPASLQHLAVPEPTSLALLGLGGLLVARRRR